MGVTRILGALALAGTVGLFATTITTTGAEAQQTQSRLFEVTKSKKVRVCQFPLYYSISFRNPKTGEIEGIDVGDEDGLVLGDSDGLSEGDGDGLSVGAVVGM